MNFENKLNDIEKQVDMLVSHYNLKDDEFKVKLGYLKQDLIESQIDFIKNK